MNQQRAFPEKHLEHEENMVMRVGRYIGYGRVMDIAQKLWSRQLVSKYGFGGGALMIGPCEAATVPCGCENQRECEWCGGCGWLTKKVRRIKDGQNE